MKSLHKNTVMLLLAGITLFLSFLTHFLHRYTSLLDSYLFVKGVSNLSGGLLFLQNLLFFIPIILFICSLAIHKVNINSTFLPWMIVSTLTFSSISIIAGGDGLVEYHFSIFMVIAMIAYYDNIKLIVFSTTIFAIHHLGGIFFSLNYYVVRQTTVSHYYWFMQSF